MFFVINQLLMAHIILDLIILVIWRRLRQHIVLSAFFVNIMMCRYKDVDCYLFEN
jgi:hypothetical protein